VLDALLEQAGQDENVIGVVVHGSRGRGLHVHERSDWDVIVVAREPGGRYESERGGGQHPLRQVCEVRHLERSSRRSPTSIRRPRRARSTGR
jgi:predicted nucleotidyltransferase